MFAILLLQLSFSFWSDSAIRQVQTFTVGKDDNGFVDAFQISMWGSAKAKTHLVSWVDTSAVYVLDMFKQPVPYMFYLQKKSFWEFDKATNERKKVERIKKAPVLIYLPGIFNNPDDGQSRRALSEYKDLGYHVFVLPNPWSEAYIKANPNKVKPGDVVKEAQALLRVSEEVIKTIPKQMISGVALVGASYGGFLAGVVSGLDQNNFFTLGTTIIGPPMDFRYSLPFMDELMDEELERGYNLSLLDLADIGSDFLFASVVGDLDPKSQENTKAFIAKKGFHDYILATIRTYDSVHKSGWVPRFSSEKEKIEWEKSIRFVTYFKTYAPEALLLLETEVANLSYWMNVTLSAGRKVRLLTTMNDFLNPIEYPTKSDFEFYSPSVRLELPSGGHLGFLALPWYQKFRDSSWAIQ